jgi:hypothetical protein
MHIISVFENRKTIDGLKTYYTIYANGRCNINDIANQLDTYTFDLIVAIHQFNGFVTDHHWIEFNDKQDANKFIDYLESINVLNNLAGE